METNKKKYIEQIKKSKKISEINIPIKSQKYHINSDSNVHKINSPEKAIISTDKNINQHIESIKFPESNIKIKSHKNHKNLYFNEYKLHSHEKIDQHKKYKRSAPDILKTQKKKLNDNNSPKHNHRRHHKSSQLASNFHGKSLFCKNVSKSQDKPIKINLVSQKFKIADDFNEKNSNQFLNEKDECLREEILSDKIEEEEDNIHFYAENEKRNINHLLYTKTRKINCNLNSKQIKRKMIKAKLIKELK